ncbi:DUF2442 domain-containing protein [Marinospirillum perlucidum]|uniref:DUF2442 domain-containing protein n=1 Tax=Marinospirillum perlucidum TaxID=1982602 RepID=UPI000DF1A8ED|nr:DUF2442 domain-containing protein [Marinospirillum perlucidum]
MSPRVVNVWPLEGYRLYVTFDNGEAGELSLDSYLDLGVFAALKDKNEFNKVHVAFKTIEWACGVDLDPEFVYQHTLKSKPAKQA